MAIDWSKLSGKQAKTNKLLDEMYGSDIRPELRAGRESFLSETLDRANLPENMRTGLSVAKSQQSQKLEREAGRRYAENKLNQNREKYTLKFNTYFNRAVNSGQQYREAIDFANQKLMQDIELEFQAEQAQKDRESGLRRLDMGERYQNLSSIAEREFTPKFDYNSALIRALSGLGGSVVSYGLMTRGQNQPKLSNYVNSGAIGENISQNKMLYPDDYLRTSTGFVR